MNFFTLLLKTISRKAAKPQRKADSWLALAPWRLGASYFSLYLFFIIIYSHNHLFSQELELYGYYEPQLMTATFDDHFYNSASNKLRLDVGKDWDNISFGANVNYITYHGKTEWNLIDYLPQHIGAQIPSFMQEYFKFYFGDMAQWVGPAPTPRPDRIFLDNAFAKIRYKKADITVGKQQLNMGAGYTWNPTDAFNVKNVLDPTYEQTGHNAIRLELALNAKLSIDSYFAPGEEMKDSGAMLKLKSNFGRFDVSVLGVQNYWQRTDYLNPAAVVDPNAAFSTYQRQMLGGDIVGELFGLGVWAEGGYTFVDLKKGSGLPDLKNFWELVLGLDYTFNSGLYLMGEFYRNSLLPAKWQDYTLNHWMWYFSTETRAMSQDNFFGLLQYPLTDLITIGGMLIQSISDGSAAIVPMLTWSMFEDAELLTYVNINTGKDGQAYAVNSGSGGVVRLRVYF
jgi:hypothetical protein